MMSSNERKRIKAQVEFTRSGWRQLARLNRSLGARLIRAFVLCHELSAYLAEHEASGVHLDTECQEVRYVDGVYLLLRRSQGIWYITDVFAAEEGDGYEPMYFWQRVRRGAGCVLIRLLIGWRQPTRRAVARECEQITIAVFAAEMTSRCVTAILRDTRTRRRSLPFSV